MKYSVPPRISCATVFLQDVTPLHFKTDTEVDLRNLGCGKIMASMLSAPIQRSDPTLRSEESFYQEM